MVTQLQPDVRAYLHGGEVIKRYIKVEEVAYESMIFDFILLRQKK